MVMFFLTLLSNICVAAERPVESIQKVEQCAVQSLDCSTKVATHGLDCSVEVLEKADDCLHRTESCLQSGGDHSALLGGVARLLM